MRKKNRSKILGDPNSGIYNAAVEQYKKRDIRNINFATTLTLARLVK